MFEIGGDYDFIFSIAVRALFTYEGVMHTVLDREIKTLP